jgi:hypothetical protein
MKKIFFLYIAFSPLLSFAQNSLQAKLDSLCTFTGAQYQMNRCAVKQYEYLDSIIQKKLSCIYNYLDLQINEAKQDSDFVKTLTQSRMSIKSSQQKWEEYRKANAKYYSMKSGSMSSMSATLCSIIDAKDRIGGLDILIEDLSHGMVLEFICK